MLPIEYDMHDSSDATNPFKKIPELLEIFLRQFLDDAHQTRNCLTCLHTNKRMCPQKYLRCVADKRTPQPEKETFF